jgi:pimeloyl-ACP methyl ester carboxylesterase
MGCAGDQRPALEPSRHTSQLVGGRSRSSVVAGRDLDLDLRLEQWCPLQIGVRRYHKRGWVGSTHTPPPVSIADHAADAAALLEQLGVRRAHIAGHSTGASIAAQLALDYRS